MEIEIELTKDLESHFQVHGMRSFFENSIHKMKKRKNYCMAVSIKRNIEMIERQPFSHFYIFFLFAVQVEISLSK